MPIYEYECEKCGGVFEVFQKVSDPPPKGHTCGSRKVRRIMSQTSFILKGSGWYVTDYARKENGSASEGQSSKRASDSNSKGSDSKNADSSSKDPGSKGSGSKDSSKKASAGSNDEKRSAA